jgi:hypothetical protein
MRRVKRTSVHLVPRVAVAVVVFAGALVVATIKEWDPILLGAAFVLPVLAALYQRPQRGVLLLAALVPFDGLLVLVPHPPAVQYWKEGLVVVILVASLVTGESARAPIGRARPPWLPGLAGLVIIGLVSAVAVGGIQAI